MKGKNASLFFFSANQGLCRERFGRAGAGRKFFLSLIPVILLLWGTALQENPLVSRSLPG
jgi:hypothetical protein